MNCFGFMTAFILFLFFYLQATEVSPAEVFGDSLSHEADMYKLTLNICLILLFVGTICGCIYEFRRRKKHATKVKPEGMNIHFILSTFDNVILYFYLN